MIFRSNGIGPRCVAAALVLVTALAQGNVDPNDLNIEAAKARHDAQKAISDRALGRLEDYKRVFADIEGRYLAAVGRLNSAEGMVNRIRGEVERIERDLRSAEDEVPRQQSALSAYRDERSRLQTQLDRLRRDEFAAERSVRDAQHQIRRAEDELADERRKPEPDENRLRELERRVSQARRALNDHENRLRRAQQDVRSVESQIRSKDDDIVTVERRLEELRIQISRLGRDRDNARDRLTEARVNVERARGEVALTSSQVDAARIELSLRESEFGRENAITQTLWAEYQAVLANYNRERDRILRMAADAAGVDGYREGIERGNLDGAAAGQSAAIRAATEAGTQQAKARDRARGYRDGREKGKVDPALASAYGTGVMSGKAIAARKGEGEAYPRGYAAELDSHFAGPPALTAVVDVAEAPTDAGTQAPVLSLEKPPVRPVAAPTYPLPPVPGGVVPSAPQVSVSAPTPDRRYYSEPCNNVPRPEFGTQCKERYAQAYADAVRRGYLAGYGERFREAFQLAVGPAHAQAFAVEQPAELAAGRADGARDQGVLDGFAEALPAALAEQEAAGRAAWRRLQEAGVLVRSVSTALVDDDGLFAGGERLGLDLVLDNYGGQATAKDGYQLRVRRLEGLAAKSLEPVKLPALAGNTRTTLKNALALEVAALPAGSRVRFEGSLERADGIVIANVVAEGRITYPVEVEKIVVPPGARVGQKADVTVTLRNRRPVATAEASLKVSTQNGSVTFAEEPVVVPGIPAGGTVDVVVAMTPSAWVGGNVHTPFLVTVSEGDSRSTQPFSALFPVRRNASLHVVDRNGAAVPSGRFVVQANTFTPLLFRVSNEVASYAPGPFGVRAIRTSDPTIVIPTGHTIAYNYGAMNPGTAWQAQSFTYFIPPAMKGKTAWVQIGLFEGPNWLHVVQIELDVR